ncbi:MAG: AbrB/MazE/SpoVT family DNA-binding domain-containing protein [Candidatus Nucleicultricaceae bacterium]|jgi:bifunctional DNA-binding transcriptional regulator/antitoxin component of YhaV-PrlF toxin-antitoxin module
MVKLRKISRGFQITLPQEFRDRHRLEIGDFIEVVEEGDRVVLKAFRAQESESPVDKVLKLLASEHDDESFDLYENEDDFLKSFEKKKKKTA